MTRKTTPRLRVKNFAKTGGRVIIKSSFTKKFAARKLNRGWFIRRG